MSLARLPQVFSPRLTSLPLLSRPSAAINPLFTILRATPWLRVGSSPFSTQTTDSVPPPPSGESQDPPRPSFPRVTHKNEIKLRCTEFDQNGNVKTTAGEFSKQQLCSEHGLQPRDLRKIDSHFIDQLPAILVRDHAILVNLAHIRALIKADLVVLFDPYGSTDSYQQSIFIYDLQDRLRSASSSSSSSTPPAPPIPFEFRALEAVFISVTSSLQREAQVLHGMIMSLLTALEEEIERDRLKELLQYSKRLSLFDRKVSTIRAAILDVLDQDEDLAGMYLSDERRGRPHDPQDHEEIEILLETYLKQVEEVANTVANLSAHVRSTEEIVNIMLDSQRNNLLLFELRLAVGTLGVSVGTMVAGIFGMNLLSGWEHKEGVFAVVTCMAIAISGTIWRIGTRRLKHLARRT